MNIPKFRAWHKVRKQMFEVLALHLSGLNGREKGAWINNGAITIFASFDVIELMQYTGVNDENGNETYPMDVLLVKSTDGDKYKTIVSCRNYKQIPSIDTPWLEYEETALAYAIDYFSSASDWGAKIFRLGNLYDSPELLSEVE